MMLTTEMFLDTVSFQLWRQRLSSVVKGQKWWDRFKNIKQKILGVFFMSFQLSGLSWVYYW